MKNARTTIAKNAGALMSSQIITWGLSLLTTIFVPRYLGPVGIGELQIAGSIWAIMGVLIAFGTDTLLTKEIARYPEKAAQLLGTTFIVRSVLFIASFALIALYLLFQHYSPTVVYLVAIISISHLVSQWVSASGAAMRGMEIMGSMSVASIIGEAVNTGIGIAFLLLGYGVYGIAATGILAGLTTLLIQMVFLRRQTSIILRCHLDQTITMLRTGAPYLLSGLTLILYTQIDTLVISWFVNTTTIGWYSVAMKLFGNLFFVPVVLTSAIFPALTRQHAKNPMEMPKLIRKSFDLMLLISVPLGLGMLTVSTPLVVLLFGSQFAPSGPVLALLGIVLIFTYQNMLFGQFLISIDRQNAWTVVMIVATVVTVVTDIPIIPWCERTFNNGAIGGAITFILAELGMTIAGLYLMPKGSLGKANAWTAARILAAGIVMVAGTWWCRDMFIGVPVILGAVIYVGLIIILRVIPAEDILVVKELAQHMIARVRQRKQIGVEGA